MDGYDLWFGMYYRHCFFSTPTTSLNEGTTFWSYLYYQSFRGTSTKQGMPVVHSKSQIIPIHAIHNSFFSQMIWPMLRSSSVTLEALTTATCITIKSPLLLIHHRYQKSSMISNESTLLPQLLLLLLLEAPFHLEKYNDRSRFKHTNDNDQWQWPWTIPGMLPLEVEAAVAATTCFRFRSWRISDSGDG